MSEYISIKIIKMLDTLEKNKYICSDKTIEYALEVYSKCADQNYETGMAYALLRVGEVYLSMSKYEKAITYSFDSIKLSQGQGICDLQLLAYINIGNTYFDIGEYEKSLDYYNLAESLAEIFATSENYYKDFCSEFYFAKIYNNIGEIYRVLECYEDAIIYYNLSVNLDRKLNCEDKFGIGIELSNLGYVEYHLGNYDKALEYVNEALIYLINNDYKIGIVETYRIVALIYEKKEDYEECEKYFFKALNLSSEIAYIYGKIDLFLDLINFLDKANKREVAIEKLNEVYDISLGSNMYAKTMEICKRAIELYEKENDINNTNKYYKLYFENEKKFKIKELETKGKNLKIKIKLDSLEKENKSILEKSEAFRRKAEDLIEVIKNISIISELGEKITTTLDLSQINQMLYDTVQSFMKANTFGVAIYNDEKRAIEYQYLIENNVRTENHEVDFDNEPSMAVKCLKENKIIVINDMHNEYLNYIDDVSYITIINDNYELNSAIYCPLIIDNNLIGVITVQAKEKNSFTMITIEMIKALSSYAAIAINNAIKSMRLLDEVQQKRKVQIQLEDINNKLIYLSENDALTDIPNRRKFDSVIIEQWNKAKENKNSISIIIFDVDCFKQYNDNYGHTTGDSCLISISNELSRSLVKNYFAARYGGDEFVIVLPDTNLEEAKSQGENFRHNIEKLSILHEYSKVKNIVTVTLGVSSVVPSNESTIIEFIRQADNALYEAKNRGRNQIIGAN